MHMMETHSSTCSSDNAWCSAKIIDEMSAGTLPYRGRECVRCEMCEDILTYQVRFESARAWQHRGSGSNPLHVKLPFTLLHAKQAVSLLIIL